MSKLILSIDDAILKEIALNKERMTIGRKPHNDIQIDNLAISGEHAAIITINGDSFLEDLNSTNGTFVNGQAVRKHFLQSGEVITLGKYSLKYINDATPAQHNDDFERTMVFRPGTAAIAAMATMTSSGVGGVNGWVGGEGLERAASPLSQPATASAAAGKPLTGSDGVTESAVAIAAETPEKVELSEPSLPLGALQILSGNNVGKELELTKNLTTLGKPKIQVAVIARRPQGYFISHLEGANFPLINGHPSGSQPYELNDYDIIELAGVKMTFFLKS
jgi:pSer/pThr/pTyr-binding forkhead associated (FHA) protein